jgi:hypothetical protein
MRVAEEGLLIWYPPGLNVVCTCSARPSVPFPRRAYNGKDADPWVLSFSQSMLIEGSESMKLGIKA